MYSYKKKKNIRKITKKFESVDRSRYINRIINTDGRKENDNAKVYIKDY